ncbi:MAG: gamma carbonic anhydrase family protein [Candidatus Omnitrophota bacterium]|nr:MAG: gamma carbonic anhydrase family protein [Candidatus Omnitrophota bacterium]
MGRRLKDYKYIRSKPKVSPKAFVASGVKLIGAVSIGDYSSIWYNAVIRADINRIEIGSHTNIQDACILHVSDELGVKIADYVTVGHGAILHACSVQSGAVIGLGAKVLNAANIGAESVVAAGTLVPPKFVVPARTLAKGHPAKIARKLTKKEIEENRWWANKYEQLIGKYRKHYQMKT